MSSTCSAPKSPPVVLSIAGSDNSAGAGIQADLKTMSALEVFGLTAVTCVVAEVPGRVTAIHPVPPEVVAEQIRILFEGFPIAAVKTGMLHSAATLGAVVDALNACRGASGAAVPLVVDPVMVATSNRGSGHAQPRRGGGFARCKSGGPCPDAGRRARAHARVRDGFPDQGRTSRWRRCRGSSGRA
jgi:hypothetical protein